MAPDVQRAMSTQTIPHHYFLRFAPGIVGLLTAICASAQSPDDGASPAAGTPPPPTLADARDWLLAGKYEEAIDAYEAVGANPSHTLEAGLGIARCRLQTGQYREAVQSLTDLGATQSADWHYTIAHPLGRLGRYPEVLSHAREAIKIDRDHAGARLLLGETLELLGRRDEAVDAYKWFERELLRRPELPRDAEWVTDTAVGFLRYTVLTQISSQLDQATVVSRTKHVLHEMLQMAYERLDRTWWPARIAAANLLREKFNNDPDDGCVADYEAALRVNPNLSEAHVGLGEVALQGFGFEEVERRVELALETNPNHAPALHLLAKKLIVERRYRQARETCARALAINPNDIDALSLSIAAGNCLHDSGDLEQLRARIAAINPKCARLHRVLGDVLGGIRQYAESEKEYQKAIEIEPADVNARTELGMMYMQWGVEDKARDALERAWELDPFNERTKFTLELLDSLQRFATHESAHFIIRHDAERDPGLGAYAASYLESIYEIVTSDYDASLKQKTIVEIFPTQREFAVRITGKPWVHTIGACTGRVIALASPRKSVHLMGPYDWARVLKHEFTHTVTLAATQNRIPHWFTEGLAVSQEEIPRDFAWSRLLAEAVRRDRLFTLESIDWGFIRPERPTDRQLAYAQSEWMCEYITDRFGYHQINAMLARFRRGQTNDDVFREQLGIPPDEFDRDFGVWAGKEVKRWGFDGTPPEDVLALRDLAAREGDNASVQGRLAKAEWDENDHERALGAARRALELDANEPNALEVMANVLAARMDEDPPEATLRDLENDAMPVLERLLQVDPDGWTAPRILAAIALRRKNHDRAAELLKRLQRLCPMDPISWHGLAGIYLDRGHDDRALVQLLELARTNSQDPDIPAKIARIYKGQSRLHDARYWYRRALYIDPFNGGLHQALGDTSMQAGDAAAALREYTILTQIGPTNPTHFESAAYAAHKLGDKEKASQFAQRAVELDPDSGARALLP